MTMKKIENCHFNILMFVDTCNYAHSSILVKHIEANQARMFLYINGYSNGMHCMCSGCAICHGVNNHRNIQRYNIHYVYPIKSIGMSSLIVIFLLNLISPKQRVHIVDERGNIHKLVT